MVKIRYEKKNKSFYSLILNKMDRASAIAAVQRRNFWRQRRNLHRTKIGLPAVPMLQIDNGYRNLKIAGGLAIGSTLLSGAYGLKKLWDKRRERQRQTGGRRRKKTRRRQRGGTITTPYCYASGRKNCMLRHIHQFTARGIRAIRDRTGEDPVDRFLLNAAQRRSRRRGHYI